MLRQSKEISPSPIRKGSKPTGMTYCWISGCATCAAVAPLLFCQRSKTPTYAAQSSNTGQSEPRCGPSPVFSLSAAIRGANSSVAYS